MISSDARISFIIGEAHGYLIVDKKKIKILHGQESNRCPLASQ